MIVLGVESSCDETGVGVVDLAADGTVTILADKVASSMQEHARFGGVVPEIASRAHLEQMGPVMRAALAEAGVARPDAVAATVGPGLAGALLVGASAAKAYAAAWDVPFVIVRSISDTADHSAHVDFRSFTRLAAERADRIVTGMLARLAPQPSSAVPGAHRG